MPHPSPQPPSPEPSSHELTLFLTELSSGEAAPDSRLWQYVLEQLRSTAGAYLRRQSPGHSLQPTGLVHEAFIKLFDREAVDWNDRTHFFALAAKAMRQILVDHARRRSAKGAQQDACPLELISDGGADAQTVDLIDLDEALEELAAHDERESQVVELRFFGGLTIPETAKMLQVSTSTVERDWAMARAWLGRRLGIGEER